MTRVCTLIMLAWASLGLGAGKTDYFVVLLEGKKVGYAVQERRVEDEQVITSEQVYVSVSRLGVPVRLQMTETAIETIDGRPLATPSWAQRTRTS